MGQLGKLGDVALGTATTPEDHQQILAAEYVNSSLGPVIAGGEVTGRGDLQYAYSAGVGQVPTAAGAVRVNWSAGTTALVSTPGSTRTDVIYADDNGDVWVAPGGVGLPAAACILDKRSLPAGSTSTNASTSVWNRRWALPFGAQLGWLAMFVETYNHGLEASQDRFVWKSLNFWVPTDRYVQVRMHQAIYGQHDAGAPYTDFTNAGFGTMKYWVYLDNVLKREFELSYTRAFEPKLYFVDLEPDFIASGHTLRVERQHVWGAKPYHFGSATNQPGSVGIFDQGVRE